MQLSVRRPNAGHLVRIVKDARRLQEKQALADARFVGDHLAHQRLRATPQ